MLNPEQKKQINKQIKAYENQKETSVVKITVGNREFELEVDKFVANPDIMNSGVQVVEYLAGRPEIVKNKVVTDMGTGSGIIGVAAGLLEAKKVFMPDIDEKAVANADKNIERLKLGKICEAFQSNLFENFGDRKKADVQIFNHPFFSEQPIEGKDWTRIMLGGTELISRYFKEAPNYSTPDAKYILPWLTLADNQKNQLDNDPGKRALEYGYKIINIVEQKPVRRGIQRALFKIYELEKES